MQNEKKEPLKVQGGLNECKGAVCVLVGRLGMKLWLEVKVLALSSKAVSVVGSQAGLFCMQYLRERTAW